MATVTHNSVHYTQHDDAVYKTTLNVVAVSNSNTVVTITTNNSTLLIDISNGSIKVNGAKHTPKKCDKFIADSFKTGGIFLYHNLSDRYYNISDVDLHDLNSMHDSNYRDLLNVDVNIINDYISYLNDDMGSTIVLYIPCKDGYLKMDINAINLDII